MDRPAITAIVHTRDSAETLAKALASLRWAEELIVADMDSRDETLEIARRYGARIIPLEPVPRVDGVRDRVTALAAHPWILVLDSDEWLAEDAESGVAALIAEQGDRFDAFALPRFNYVGEQWLRAQPWYPDNQIRLFRRGTVTWPDAIHVSPRMITGWQRLKELQPPGCLHIHHRNYRDLRDFVRRQLEYALSEQYDDRPERFDFGDHVAKAYEQLALRQAPDRDGDLSQAVALLLAWDAVVRGVLHWESLDPRPPLGAMQALPIASCRVPRWLVVLRRWSGARLPWLFLFRTVRRMTDEWLSRRHQA